MADTLDTKQLQIRNDSLRDAYPLRPNLVLKAKPPTPIPSPFVEYEPIDTRWRVVADVTCALKKS